MKLLLLADEPDVRLWDHLDRSLLEGIDLVISCGDLPASYLSFLTCFTSAPILYVHGNHDSRYDQKPPEGCVNIDGRLGVFCGLRILGLGGSMRYKPGPHMYSEKEMNQRIRKLRPYIRAFRGFDILVGHAPLEGVGDASDLAHRGFASLKKLVDKHRPAYYIHGHVHKNYDFRFRREQPCGDTTVVNAWTSYIIDVPDKNYKPSPLQKLMMWNQFRQRNS